MCVYVCCVRMCVRVIYCVCARSWRVNLGEGKRARVRQHIADIREHIFALFPKRYNESAITTPRSEKCVPIRVRRVNVVLK